MTKTLFKLYTDRKDILDLADKMDCFTLIDKSRIDGSPIYQVELTTYQRILKIKNYREKKPEYMVNSIRVWYWSPH